MLTRSLKFYYRYSKNELPGYVKQMISPILATHPYATRNQNAPLIPAPSYNLTKKRIRYYIPKVLNNIPQIITDKINTHSYFGFSKYIKTYLINEYSETCTIINCQICNR